MKYVQKSNNGSNISDSQTHREESFFKICPGNASLSPKKEGAVAQLSKKLKNFSTQPLQKDQ